MKTLYRLGLSVLVTLAPLGAFSQQPESSAHSTGSVSYSVVPGTSIVVFTVPAAQKGQPTITLSGIATTARIADPNERVLFSGHVMRMEDFVAAVSSSSAEVPRPRIPVTHNRETDQPIPQSLPKD